MPFIINEQEEKKEAEYLKYENENILILKSNLYKIDFHFLPSKKRSVACRGKECSFCQAGFRKNSEYNYYVNLNGQEGALNIKPSVFFNIQGLSKAMKKDPRQIRWFVLRKGQGLETEYAVSKDENLSEEEYKKITEDLGANNAKLAKLMAGRERQLNENYQEFKDQIDGAEKENGESKPDNQKEI